jgi:hypothetical protein
MLRIAKVLADNGREMLSFAINRRGKNMSVNAGATQERGAKN